MWRAVLVSALLIVSVSATVLQPEIVELNLRWINASNAVCNDGTNSGYYYRSSVVASSSKWVFQLAGGWYCFNQLTCDGRWQMQPYGTLMSSKNFPPVINIGGIESPDPAINPDLWDAHTVFIPYCSSDLWFGNYSHPSPAVGNWSFHGVNIIKAVMDDLLKDGLSAAQTVVFSGSSAGGVGVLNNVDRVQSYLPWAKVYGMADSGWFLDEPPYAPENCSTFFNCPLQTSLPEGMVTWQGLPPQACVATMPADQAWKCSIGKYMYPVGLRTPTMVMQYMYDAAQADFENALVPAAEPYLQQLALKVVASVVDVPNVFMPSCFLHTIVQANNWASIVVDGRTLPQLLGRMLAGEHHQVIDKCFTIDCNKTCTQ